MTSMFRIGVVSKRPAATSSIPPRNPYAVRGRCRWAAATLDAEGIIAASSRSERRGIGRVLDRGRMGPVVGSEGSEGRGCVIAAMVVQAALLALMFLFWLLVVSHPSDDPEDARAITYVNVSLISALVAFGGLFAASVSHRVQWLTLAAGASYVAVAAGDASGVDIMLTGAILLAVLPSGLLFAGWLEKRGY